MLEESFGGGHVADDVGTLLSQDLLVGLGVLVELAAYQTLAVANHPYLTTDATEDDCRGTHAFLGLLAEQREPGLAIVAVDVSRHPSAELTAADGLGDMAQVLADELHAVSSVGAEQAVAQGALAGTAVDDGNEVIGDDESVFTFPVGTLGNDALFDNLHAFVNFLQKYNNFGKKSTTPCIFLANCLFIP